jgi:hypothetical protein
MLDTTPILDQPSPIIITILIQPHLITSPDPLHHPLDPLLHTLPLNTNPLMPNHSIHDAIHIPHQRRDKRDIQVRRQLGQRIHIKAICLCDAQGGEFAFGEQFLERGDQGVGCGVARPKGEEDDFAGLRAHERRVVGFGCEGGKVGRHFGSE